MKYQEYDFACEARLHEEKQEGVCALSNIIAAFKENGQLTDEAVEKITFRNNNYCIQSDRFEPRSRTGVNGCGLISRIRISRQNT